MRIQTDLETGEPVINLEGDLVETSTSRAFYHLIDNLLHTPILSEFLLPTWGLDVNQIIEVSDNPSWESLVKYLVVTALSPNREPMIESVEDVDVTKNNDELQIDVYVKSTYGTITKNMVSINE